MRAEATFKKASSSSHDWLVPLYSKVLLCQSYGISAYNSIAFKLVKRLAAATSDLFS
jgi:hypothetical protein